MTINVIVDEIMSMYSLVMITEYMEESLILMAHTFNWSLDDVRFFSVNKNANSEERRDGELVAKVNAWSAADAALYARANETFWRKIDEYGVDRMSVAKQELMRRNQELFDHCVDKLVTIKRTDIMKKKQLAKLKPDDPRWNLSIASYKLSNEGVNDQLCREMTMDEHLFNKLLWFRQNCENQLPKTPKTLAQCAAIKIKT